MCRCADSATTVCTNCHFQAPHAIPTCHRSCFGDTCALVVPYMPTFECRAGGQGAGIRKERGEGGVLGEGRGGEGGERSGRNGAGDGGRGGGDNLVKIITENKVVFFYYFLLRNRLMCHIPFFFYLYCLVFGNLSFYLSVSACPSLFLCLYLSSLYLSFRLKVKSVDISEESDYNL